MTRELLLITVALVVLLFCAGLVWSGVTVAHWLAGLRTG